MSTLLRLAAALGQYAICPGCGFWYDTDKSHACYPC